MFMFHWLGTPFLQSITSIDQESFLFFSYLIGAVMTAPLWAWVFVQYLLKRRVEYWLLQTIMLFTIVHALFFVNWYVAVALSLMSMLAYGIRCYRQTVSITFTVLAHWLTATYCYGGGMLSFYFLSGFFIITTIFINLIFRYPGWKQWIKGEYVSIIPSYTFSIIFMVVLQFHFIEMLAL